MPTRFPSNRDLVLTFYREVWNAWDGEAATRLLHPQITFRGSLGRRTQGRDGFLTYVAEVRAAFPDFHNEVTDLLTDADKATARLTYTGTHKGEVLGYPRPVDESCTRAWPGSPSRTDESATATSSPISTACALNSAAARTRADPDPASQVGRAAASARHRTEDLSRWSHRCQEDRRRRG